MLLEVFSHDLTGTKAGPKILRNLQEELRSATGAFLALLVLQKAFR